MLLDGALGDAFGRVLTRCWEAGVREGVAFEIVERDDGHIGATDAVTYFADADSWSEPERWGREQAVGRVLDIGCGAGRHAVVMSAKGCDVVGLDPSPGAAAVASERGVRVVQGTVADLPSNIEPFDTFTLLGNNFGLIGPGDAGTRFLMTLASVARPGARLIGSGLDPYATDDPEHLAYHELNRQRGRLPGHTRIRIRDGACATEWFDYVFRSPDELAAVVEESPWTLSEIERSGPTYCARMDLGTSAQ